MKTEHLELLRLLLVQPTASFHEQAVVRQVRTWAAGRKVDCSLDAPGNVLLRYRNGQPRMRWAFEAHLDHPGFVAGQQDGRLLRADFLGTVAPSYFPGSRVRFFGPGPEESIAGTILDRSSPPAGQEWPLCRIEMDDGAPVAPDSVGMWDFPGMAIDGRVLSSRGCDDVVGCAAALAALGDLAAAAREADVTVLLTRAEEVGGMGAIAAADAGVLSQDTLVVGIETSKAQPGAALGDGVVVRVGDRIRTFEPMLTAAVSTVAEDLAKTDPAFRFVRHLMPGGSCESTIWCQWGYRATGVCLPLGNYHNQGADGKIAPEQVNLDDFECTVKLLVALAWASVTPQEHEQAMLARWRNLMDRRGKFLRTSL